MKPGLKRGLLIGGGVILLGAIVIANVAKGQGGRQGVQVNDVAQGDLSSTVRAPAKVQPETHVKLSANVPGEVVRIAVKEGNWVRKGQFLLELDGTQYRAQLRQSQAALDAAKSSLRLSEVALEQAESDLRRKEQLFERKLVSPQEIETSRTQANAERARVDVNREEVARSSAAILSAQDNLRKTVFTAPIAGTVTQLNVERGEIVMVGTMNNPGTVILSIADLRRMKVEADVDETDVAAIRIGQGATVKVDALPDTTLTGSVVEIANSPKVTELGTQEQQTNFVVDVMIDHPPSTLRPGMTADVEIKTGTRSGILHVPIQAVVVRTAEELAKARAKSGRKSGEATATAAEPDPQKPAGKSEEIKGVFVMVGGEAQFRKVRTGISSDTDLEVSGDVKAKEKVITGPSKVLRQLKPGSKVKIEEPKMKKGETK
jgi:HlyD family secretion protein